MSAVKPLVVVTGGAGFIGSHTVDALIRRGARVVVLDNFCTGKRENLAAWADRAQFGFGGTSPALEILPVDIAHGIFAPLAAVTAQWGPVERIVHLAAQVSVVHSLANPLFDAAVNYGGTLAVLEYARAMHVRKVVFASSAAVYGDVEEFPTRETAAKVPMSPYGIHKYASELALQMYAQTHGVAATALRFFNVFGPRQDPSSPYSGVISIFADRAKRGLPLTIFGDGQQSRDFVYVGDVASALVAALFADERGFAVANVGTGREVSVRALAEQVVALRGGASPIVHAPARAGEIYRSVACVDELAHRYGVVAQMPFAEGLAATLA